MEFPTWRMIQGSEEWFTSYNLPAGDTISNDQDICNLLKEYPIDTGTILICIVRAFKKIKVYNTYISIYI